MREGEEGKGRVWKQGIKLYVHTNSLGLVILKLNVEAVLDSHLHLQTKETEAGKRGRNTHRAHTPRAPTHLLFMSG